MLGGGGLELWAELEAAGLDPALEDVRDLRAVMAETATENSILGDWAFGPPAPEPSYGLSNDLAELDRLREARQRHDQARAMSRAITRRTLREGDFMTAARIHIDLSQDPLGPGR